MIFNNTRCLVLSHKYLHNPSRTGREGSVWRKSEARRDWGIVAGGTVVEEVAFPFTACQSIMAQSTAVGADS